MMAITPRTIVHMLRLHHLQVGMRGKHKEPEDHTFYPQRR